MDKPDVNISSEEMAEFMGWKDYLLLGVVEYLEVGGTAQTMVTVEAKSPEQAMEQARKIVDNPGFIHAILEINGEFRETVTDSIEILATYYNHSEGDKIIISKEP
jgi:PP-loop superfamily ATP-utilizing enzyme